MHFVLSCPLGQQEGVYATKHLMLVEQHPHFLIQIHLFIQGKQQMIVPLVSSYHSALRNNIIWFL